MDAIAASQHSHAEAVSETSMQWPMQMSVRRAAVILGLSRMTLYRMRERGEIKFACHRGKAMIAVEEVKRVHWEMTGAMREEPVARQADASGGPSGGPRNPRPRKTKLIQQLR